MLWAWLAQWADKRFGFAGNHAPLYHGLNLANAPTGPPQVKARTFEVPGAGGFLLTENAAGLNAFRTGRRCIVVFEGISNEPV